MNFFHGVAILHLESVPLVKIFSLAMGISGGSTMNTMTRQIMVLNVKLRMV